LDEIAQDLDPKVAKSLLKPATLVTPTAAEKILGDAYDSIEALVDKPAKQPVAAPVTDRRSKWVGQAPEAMFQDES